MGVRLLEKAGPKEFSDRTDKQKKQPPGVKCPTRPGADEPGTATACTCNVRHTVGWVCQL